MRSTTLGIIPASAIAVTATLTATAPAGNPGDEVGLNELIERLGEENIPTGVGVIVGLVETFESGTQDYQPNTAAVTFQNKTFIEESGPSGISGHASTVGKSFFGGPNGNGVNESIAPGIDTIHLYSAAGFIGSDLLRYLGSPSAPPNAGPPELRIYNHSWGGNNGNNELDHAALRRADHVVVRDNVLMVVGVNNFDAPGGNLPLMSHMYNGISVGLATGLHESGATQSPYDGPGRIKPEIVSPADPNCCTSFSTPVVSAACALMLETADGLSGGSAGDNPVGRSDVIKVAILGGSVHREEWTNNPFTSGPDRGMTFLPIDLVTGVDVLNVNRSHLIITGGEHFGALTAAEADPINWVGWSAPTVGMDESRFYRMTLPDFADEAVFTITWHRQVLIPFEFENQHTADFDLHLWRIDDDDNLVSLVGDGGLPYFEEGNVVSQSLVDNVEHLYIKGLQAGEYMLEVRRDDKVDAVPDYDVAVSWFLPETPVVPGDMNGDFIVDVLDLIAVISAWGPCEDCPEDIDGDGIVGVLELINVITGWS
jgi:hypothetical protein